MTDRVLRLPRSTSRYYAAPAIDSDHAPWSQNQGGFHQSEIVCILNALCANADTYAFTEYDYYFGGVMSDYWANFVKTLDPIIVGSGYGGNLTR
ncbi:uncharacterized protein CC84DRAFT_1166988 [Paraphaeosphaeria sporulosa]|uniref:Uncharacterized protein n=1 Tax=Paraphaeosphaeria sporulosa TaxID=1460663 RepID=A0A177C972_9PLEO|nr:uncharacterized protein CC84DRAFT_1166988 [Paraphaeosphaeria sporulosa]OAG03270.1 hypothetical protein CC84DRAFT_1166988 [Paraphaeosphaeria sporulosa]